MKSQVFKMNESQERINTFFIGAVLLIAFILVFASGKFETENMNNNCKELKQLTNREAMQHAIPIEKSNINSAFSVPLEIINQTKVSLSGNVSGHAEMNENELAIINSFNEKFDEYLKPANEKPLEIEGWMVNDKFWK